jgi:hypothetical protein
LEEHSVWLKESNEIEESVLFQQMPVQLTFGDLIFVCSLCLSFRLCDCFLELFLYLLSSEFQGYEARADEQEVNSKCNVIKQHLNFNNLTV